MEHRWAIALVAASALAVLWRVIRRRWRRQLGPTEAVLVTGCDSGFGLSIVKALVEETGASLFAGCVTDEGFERLRALGPRVTAMRMDVTKDADVAGAFEEVARSGKTLYGVINNAGLGCYGWCEALALERYEKNLQINLMGAIRVTKKALPLLRRSRGRLVTMGSLGGRTPSAFGSAYVPTKAALASFQDCVRQEVYRFGVRCSLVEPGFFATGMLHRSASVGEAASAGAANGSGGHGEVDGAYGSYADKMKRTEGSVLMAERLNGGEHGVTYVIDAVVDALTAHVPKSRYLVGVDANVLGRLGPFIPDWVMDLAQTYVI